MSEQTHLPDPRISVIMPVYNGERFLRPALDSILHQTLRDFECIIIDDGSTDATPTLLADYAARDARLRIITLPENRGIVTALNQGAALARGHYLARMDADDISLPDRLRIQAHYLDQHPTIGVVGTSFRHIDAQGILGVIVHPPLSPGLIRWRALFASPMAHPTIMLRKTVFDQVGGYTTGKAQDYDLWLRLGAITDLANLPDVLVHYRVWEGSITSQHTILTESRTVDLARRSIAALLGKPVPEDAAAALRAVMALDKSTWPDDPAAIRDTAGWLRRVCAAYVGDDRNSGRGACVNAPGEGLQTLPYAEVCVIKTEVAFRLLLLARRVFRSAPGESLRLAVTALRLQPLVVGRIVAKVSGRLFSGSEDVL